jgi:predicted NUDIX family NTP pyrophosphohydrolase
MQGILGALAALPEAARNGKICHVRVPGCERSEPPGRDLLGARYARPQPPQNHGLTKHSPGELALQQSAGTLLYRGEENAETLEVLIVHPSGNYNRRAPWSIPKGEPEEGEALEAAARRETKEETGVVVGALTYLGSIRYTRSRKEVHCYAGPAPEDATPRCASWEVDRAEFVPLAEARERLHPDQQPFLVRLLAQLDDLKQSDPEQ